jgi:fumarate hydratase subunit alpha
MRTIDVAKIKDAVRELCLEANFALRKDILKALKKAVSRETNPRAKGILRSIIENAKIARHKRIAICQDTGMAAIYLEIGQDAALTGGDLKDGVNEGVAEAYRKGYLRKSVAADPLGTRKNTGTNTPAVIHIDIVPGDKVRIAASPKGFGSENKSRIKMFLPTCSVEEIKEFVLDTVRETGPDACPPLVLGIGIGGTFETAACLAKKALLRPVDVRNPSRHIAALERELLKEVNTLKIGPMGLGGKTTCLGVNILDFPMHITGLAAAVNVSCHATRSAEKVL